MMKPASISILLSFVALAQAHTRVWSVWVDGVDQGQGAGVYIRQPPSNSPVKDLTSADVRCNVNGLSAVPSTISVPAGATLEPEWFHDNRGDDIIDPSHKGPVVVYLAPADTNGEGNVWVKIAEDGYDGTQWAVDKLIANKGKHSVTIPSSLAAGEYILRAEILALHESDTLFTENSARGIQLYPSCSQITVTGSGVVALPAGVSFPGEYKDSDPGIHFNLYSEDPNSYQIPGPSVWDGTGGARSFITYCLATYK
ncbi:glycoside hydrolase family 61 protein [Flagelloscypha sp. PMI_526]|nr:glycoside hydrolase family 61 protein [Flagelloscypha sp. PMI_526]